MNDSVPDAVAAERPSLFPVLRSPRSSVRWHRLQVSVIVGVLALAGCRDSPREVLGRASEAAARGDVVEVQQLFSVATVHRLEAAWDLDQTPRASGWQALAGKLTFLGKPLEVRSEVIHDPYAMVEAIAGVEVRDYYLCKEDGRWRIELGAGQRFRKARAVAEPASQDDAG